MAWIRTALSLIGFSKGTAYPSGANCSPGVEPRSDDEFLVSFVSGAATKRIPATQFCLTHDEARRWVEHEAAKVRVLIEWSDHKKTWCTVGVSDNIIEASWKALVDAIRLELARLTEQDPSVARVVEDYCWGV